MGVQADSGRRSAACIRIQSRALAALLSRYQPLLEPKRDEDGWAIEEIRLDQDQVQIDADERADSWSRPPERLDRLTEALLPGLTQMIQWEKRDSRQALELIREIQTRREELTRSVEKVLWEFIDESDEELVEPGMAESRRFAYDRRRGGTGEYRERLYSQLEEERWEE